MKRAPKVFSLVVLAATFLTGCASKESMNALVAYKHSGSVEIDRFADSTAEIYVLCENGKVVVVKTDRTFFSADIIATSVVPADHASCK